MKQSHFRSNEITFQRRNQEFDYFYGVIPKEKCVKLFIFTAYHYPLCVILSHSPHLVIFQDEDTQVLQEYV